MISDKFPNLDFKVLYLTHTEKTFLSGRVLGVHTDEKLDYRDRDIGDKMRQVLEDNNEFIEANLWLSPEKSAKNFIPKNESFRKVVSEVRMMQVVVFREQLDV